MRGVFVIIVGLTGCGRVGFEPVGDGTEILDVGLIGHWPFEEGSGAITADTSGSSNPGMLTGGVTFTAGRIGMALSFDGIDGQVDISETTNVLDVRGGSVSYSAWINVGTPVGLYDTPWWRGGSSTSYPGYDIELGSPPWRTAVSDGVDVVGLTFTELLGQWVLLTVVVDRDLGTITAYQNGVVVDTQPMMLGSLAQARAAKMGDTVGGMAPFRGLLDDVRVYNRALTATEVDALYRQ
jgi:hypothetical protein